MLDVKRVSEILMAMRVIVGRTVAQLNICLCSLGGKVKGGQRGVSGHVGGSSAGDRFW